MISATRHTVTLGDADLSINDVVAVARHDARVEIAPGASARIIASRAIIDELAHDTRPHYGVSTGFGALAKVQIPVEKRQQLQRSLIRSHAAGTGAHVAEVVEDKKRGLVARLARDGAVDEAGVKARLGEFTRPWEWA